MSSNSTQAQRDYIASLIERNGGVEVCYKAKALTYDQAVNQGAGGGYRTPREAARHCNSKKTASETINRLKILLE